MSENAATVTFVPFFGFTACLFVYLFFCKVETLLVTGRTYRLVYHLDIFVKSCLWMPNEQGCDKIHIQRGCHPVILSPLVWRDVTFISNELGFGGGITGLINYLPIYLQFLWKVASQRSVLISMSCSYSQGFLEVSHPAVMSVQTCLFSLWCWRSLSNYQIYSNIFDK